MNAHDPESRSLLEPALQIAIEAGRRILQFYGPQMTVTHKADQSPLTEADLAAHEYIADALRTLTPELPLLSEEGADVPYATRRQWSRYWLVDPLDGTREFIKCNGEFAVNIALIEDGVAVLGVIHAPAQKRSWIAAAGCGAHERTGDQHVPLRVRTVPAAPVFAVSRSHVDPRLKAFLEAVPGHSVISSGASMKFCQVAAGEADVYPRAGPTSEWDTAAGQCIVEQAGGRVLRLPDGTPLRYNQKASLLNPPFAVIGDPRHAWLPLLRRIGPPTLQCPVP